VFISADEARMDDLERAGLVAPADRVTLLGNQLVVVVPKEGGRAVDEPRDLLGMKRIALADPRAVPAGIYARRGLEGLGLWEALEGRVVPALDVRAALAAVEVEAADAGIVYRTDAAISKKVKVAHEVPVGMGPKVVYPAAVLAGAKPEARRFLGFLKGPEARAIFERHGFRFLASPPASPPK
jgi:molybdate transport system substrate-binding protein